MDEYIKRDDAIKAFCDGCMLRGKCKLDEVYCSNRKKLNEMPSADVRENMHGEWILAPAFGGNYNFAFGCSVCGKAPDIGSITSEFKYCPWCGADMRGESDVANR